jgi:hypothetical protein
MQIASTVERVEFIRFTLVNHRPRGEEAGTYRKSDFCQLRTNCGTIALDFWAVVAHVTQGMAPAYLLEMQL